MGKSGKPSADDIALFRRSVGPVRKLQHDRHSAPQPPRKPRPRHEALPPAGAASDRFSDAWEPGEVGSDELLFHARPGLQQRQLQRLRRGQLKPAAELDLHGMTAAEARAALTGFIDLCRERHIRCALIIHGKGYHPDGRSPVLKNRLNNWLRQHHDVLAFSSATPRDGGGGALYVLLRTSR